MMHYIRSAPTFVLLLPWLITVGLFWAYPLVYAAILSFMKHSTLARSYEWVGLANYIALLSSDRFWLALKNTAVFTVGTVPVTTIFALALAHGVRGRSARLASVLRSSYFLPSVTSLVVIALVFTNLYARDGVINSLLSVVGVSGPERGWLLDTSTALPAIMAMDVWISTGYYMVLILAGMENIPRDLYETARLAGATAWQQFVRITLPLLKPTLVFILVLNSIKSFQVFVEVYVMTKGGPLGATTTLVYELYHQAFEQSDMMGQASALAYIIFLVLLVFSALQMHLLRTTSA
jgi:multiple sugar transport system permease protein